MIFPHIFYIEMSKGFLNIEKNIQFYHVNNNILFYYVEHWTSVLIQDSFNFLKLKLYFEHKLFQNRI